MRASSLFLLGLVVCAGSVSAQVTVLRTYPADGAKDVDPKLTYIRVRFSAAVDPSGYSFVNSPHGEPIHANGKPEFQDGNKLVILPVKLEPGTTYSVSINSDRYTNFRSADDGTPVTPYLLTFATSGTAPNKAALSPADRWREDLRFLATHLPAVHKNLFFKVTREQFEKQVDELDKRIPTLREDQILVGFAKLVASMGDEHTGIHADPAGLTYLPLGFYWFTDGVFVVAAGDQYRSALRCRVEKIANTDVEQAMSQLASLVAHANDAQVRNAAPSLLSKTQYLTGLGIAEHANKIRLELQCADVQPPKLEVVPVKDTGAAKMIPAYDASDSPPLYLSKPKSSFWAEYLPEHNTIYFQYDRCANSPEESLAEFEAGLRKLIEEHQSSRLVIDLRDNGGGNSALLDPFIDWLKSNERVNVKGRLFVIVGRRTFSSAVLNALRLRGETQAVFVGEPTGGRPNHYGEVQTFRLPNSGLEVSYSTKYFKHSDKDEPTIRPDVLVELTSDDYFSGRDPVLDAVFGYEP